MRKPSRLEPHLAEAKPEIAAARLAIQRAISALQNKMRDDSDASAIILAKTLIEGALELLDEAEKELL